MKKLLLILLLLLFNYSFAISLNELKEPRPIEGRLSNTDKPEIKKINKEKENIQEKKAQISAPQTKETQKQPEIINATYADLSLKRLADDISYELELDSSEINSDLAILWNATTSRSETMKYTIYKLSNPDEDKPNDSTVKKILKPIANFSSLAGASFAGDPFVATSALIGGGLVNAFMKDDKEYNYKFSKVSDADMVLLVRKIDTLQKKLLDSYIDYRTKREIKKMCDDNFKKQEEIYKLSQNKSKEELTISDVYYKNAKTASQKANDDFSTSRAILENLVGTDALKQIEEE